MLRGLFPAFEEPALTPAIHLFHHVAAGACQQVGRAVQSDKLAVINDAYPVAQGFGFFDIMVVSMMVTPA